MRFTDYAKELAAQKSLDPLRRTLRPRVGVSFWIQDLHAFSCPNSVALSVSV